MQPLQQWLKSSGPFAKTVLALSITTIVLFTNKWVYAPYVKKQRYRRAEEWANSIIEQEENGDTGSNNISY